jgi:hypothetical protein
MTVEEEIRMPESTKWGLNQIGVTWESTLGIESRAPNEIAPNEVDPACPQPVPAILRAWPLDGRLYLAGIRTEYGKNDDIVLTVRHPRTRVLLVERLPGWMLNPELTELYTFQGLFVPIKDWHAEHDIEPVYCSEKEPLVIEAVGAVPVNIVVLGSDQYSVTFFPSCDGPPEYRTNLRGPYAEQPDKPIYRHVEDVDRPPDHES